MHVGSQRGGETRTVLVYSGYTPEVEQNLAILKIAPAGIDALVLSHGHDDDSGGMVGFLTANRASSRADAPVRRRRGRLLHPQECWRQFGALYRRAILDADLALTMAEGPALVADHASTTAGSPRPRSNSRCGRRRRSSASSTASAVPGKDAGGKERRRLYPGRFDDEIANDIHGEGQGARRADLAQPPWRHQRGEAGSGGLRHRQGARRHRRLRFVPPLGDDYRHETIAAFREINPMADPAHCSVDRFYDLARDALGDKVIHWRWGTCFVFGG